MASTATQLTLKAADWTALAVDGLIIPVYQSDKGISFAGALGSLDKALAKGLSEAVADEAFKGKAGSSLTVRVPSSSKAKARRVILVGLGESDKCKLAKVESAIERAIKTVQGLDKYSSAAIVLPAAAKHADESALIASLVDGVYQATYQTPEGLAKKAQASKKDKSANPPSELKSVALITNATPTLAQKQALAQGLLMAQAKSAVKDLVNKPSNTKTTDTLADLAKALGKRPGLKANIQTNTAWIAKNMPCFFEVAKGSVATDPPKWLSVTYTPSGPIKKKIALVGKSVIFDTGGYQVKPGNSMVTMKGDMTGGAMVLSAMAAIADAKPAGVQVTAYCAATPNKIDSGAMIPDAIVETTCGKKVEIRHTDAEGRLTLIDAVAKACEDAPDEIITIATLTGAAMRAVGLCVALMATDEALSTRIFETAKTVDEPFQPLLVFESDHDDIKSKLDGADIINTSKNQNRGAQSAACFVFAGNTKNIPMAHLDIAGADMTGDEKATGIGIKTILKYLLGQANQGSTKASPAKPAPVKAASKVAAKPAAKKVTKPPSKPAPKTKASAKPVAKVAAKSAVKAAPKPVAKKAVAAKAPAKKVAKPAAKTKKK